MSESQVPISGNIASVNQTVDLTSPNSGTSIVQIGGSWSGTLVIEGSNDNVTYFSVQSLNRSLFLLTNEITSNGVYDSNTNGFQFLRIRASSWVSGAANVSVYGSDSASLTTTNSFIRGGTDGTPIGNIGSSLKVNVENSVVITPAPQTYNMFSYSEQINVISAGTDNPLLLLRNPSDSSKRIMIWQLFTGVSTSNVSAVFKIFSNPTVTTNGTSVTAKLRKVGVSYSSTSLLSTIPTITSLGSQLHAFSFGQNSSAESTISDFSITIEPNNSIVITGNPSSNNRESVVTVIWTEVPI